MDVKDLKLADLFVECDQCAGTGHYVWRPDPNKPRGIGQHLIESSGPCDKCGGRGGRFTQLGEVLARFAEILRQHGRM